MTELLKTHRLTANVISLWKNVGQGFCFFHGEYGVSDMVDVHKIIIVKKKISVTLEYTLYSFPEVC